MKTPVNTINSALLFVVLPVLGGVGGLAVTWYQFHFDSTAVGFLTIFYYLIQVIWLILSAIPNVIIGAFAGLVLAGVISLILYLIRKFTTPKIN